MAVVTKYGSGYKDPASLRAIDAVFAEGNMKAIFSKIDITNGDSIASLFYVGSIPSDAIIDVGSTYYYEAVAGVTDLDVGFYRPNGGAVIDADAIIDGDDVSSAGSQTIAGHGTITTANSNKRAWEWAGLSSDPGGFLDIVATLKAASTATKSIIFNLRYSKKV